MTYLIALWCKIYLKSSQNCNYPQLSLEALLHNSAQDGNS